MWHPEHPALPKVKEFDPEEAEKRMFPYGKIGDIRYDLSTNRMVVIEDCAVKTHMHSGEEHEHVYIPCTVGYLEYAGYTRGSVRDSGSLITIEAAQERLKEEFHKENIKKILKRETNERNDKSSQGS